jgi:DNA helicase-4
LGIVKYVTDYFQEKKKERIQELNTKYTNIADECGLANRNLLDIKNRNEYINYSNRESWRRSFASLYAQVNKSRRYQKAGINPETVSVIKAFLDHYQRFDAICTEYNKQYVEYEKIQFKALFDHTENRSLDTRQRDCIVKDEINNLVIAGAGSGKTTTIVGKVKYLMTRHLYTPEQLLVLSYTNTSATEMAERIKKETDKDIDVMTFQG